MNKRLSAIALSMLASMLLLTQDTFPRDGGGRGGAGGHGSMGGGSRGMGGGGRSTSGGAGRSSGMSGGNRGGTASRGNARNSGNRNTNVNVSGGGYGHGGYYGGGGYGVGAGLATAAVVGGAVAAGSAASSASSANRAAISAQNTASAVNRPATISTMDNRINQTTPVTNRVGNNAGMRNTQSRPTSMESARTATQNARPVTARDASRINSAVTRQAKIDRAPRGGNTTRNYRPNRFNVDGRRAYGFWHNNNYYPTWFWGGVPYYWYGGMWSPWIGFWDLFPWWYNSDYYNNDDDYDDYYDGYADNMPY